MTARSPDMGGRRIAATALRHQPRQRADRFGPAFSEEARAQPPRAPLPRVPRVPHTPRATRLVEVERMMRFASAGASGHYSYAWADGYPPCSTAHRSYAPLT